MNDYKLFQAIASACGARKRCIASGNGYSWDARLAQLSDELPSGSGIDSGCEIDLDASGDEKVVITTSFHHMDDNGCYDGWTSHTVIVTPSFYGFKLKITGPDRNEIKEYLHEVFACALDEVAPAEQVKQAENPGIALCNRLLSA